METFVRIPQRPGSRRGFTLIELMIALAVTSVVIAGIFAVFISQQQTYRSGVRARERQNQARTGADVMERALRTAGFGMEPSLAFDFDFYKCTAPAGGALPYASTMCAAGTRDANNAPDEIVFYSRDLNYQIVDAPVAGNAWLVKESSSAGSLDLVVRDGDSFADGTILQVICQNAKAYTYVTVSGNQPTAPATLSAGTVTVTLAGADPDSPFKQNSAIGSAASAGCFTSGQAVAYKINRYHFFIASDGDAKFGTNTLAPRPYLVLDTGTDRNRDGAIDNADLVPVASEVVDLQLAYVMLHNYAPSTITVSSSFIKDSDANGVWGDNPAAAEQLTALVDDEPLATQLGTLNDEKYCGSVVSDVTGLGKGTWGAYGWPCLMGKALDSGEDHRKLDHPGNIALVRLSMVTRTERADPGPIELIPPVGLPLENRAYFTVGSLTAPYTTFFPSSATARTGYSYMLVKSTVSSQSLNADGLYMF